MEPKPLPPPDASPSLAERLGAAIAAPVGGDGGASGRTLGWMLALMLPLGPLVTLGIAEWLAAETRAAAAASPARRTVEAAATERGEIARLGPNGIAATLDRVARALPPDDRLAMLAAGAGDAPRLTARIATTDPDRLRAALARDPVLSGLRSVGEAEGDGTIIVSLEMAQ